MSASRGVAGTKWDRRTKAYRTLIADLVERGITQRVIVTDFGTYNADEPNAHIQAYDAHP